MNITCPRTRRICFGCKVACTVLEPNEAATAMPEPEKPFLGVLAPIAERLGFEQTEEGINKITITTRL